MTAATVSGPEPGRRGLLRCGAAAGPLFVSVFLIEGARRPDYKPLRHPVSSLSLGPRGWIQVANFATTGMLYIAGATGLARSPGRTACSRIAVAALGSAGLGLLGSAMFHTDPVSGYPPEHPTLLPRPPRWELCTRSPPCPYSSESRPQHSFAHGGSTAEVGQAGRPTRPRQARQCSPTWGCSAQASARTQDSSTTPDCSSAPPLSPDSPGSPPCPSEQA
jgi:hypothetical protein